MIGKNFIYDSLAIPYTTAEGITQGWYADVEWTNVQTRNIVVPRQNFNGVISAPTFAEGRLIEVEGEIFDTDKVDRGTTRNIIQSTFSIENNPTSSSEFKLLEFTDDDNTEWFLRAKVYTMPEYTHDRAAAIIRFFIQLLAEDPLIYSKTLYTVNGIYGVYGGIFKPLTLPTDSNNSINEITAFNGGTFDSPAKITITGEIENPTIINQTTGKFFRLNVTMNAGDTLIIDSNDLTATLNGVNALALRADGSEWLFIQPGDNKFVMTGLDFDIDDQSKATYEIEYRYVKL